MNERRCHDILIRLADHLSAKRLEHSKQVADMAATLASYHGVDLLKARLAGLLHDCARELSFKEMFAAAREASICWGEEEEAEPVLLHAAVSAAWARERYDIADAEILQAIALHTTGGLKMTGLDKVVYLADLLEPNRDFAGIAELRLLAKHDLDAAMLSAFDGSMLHLLRCGSLLHPATVKARNELLLRMRAAKKGC